MREKEKDIFLRTLKLNPAQPDTLTVNLGGEKIKIYNDPIFIREATDTGTQLLAEAAAIREKDFVLNIFCGSGIVGIFAARKASNGQVVLLGTDMASLEATRRNLTLNNVEHARLLQGEDLAQLLRDSFNVVLLNILLQSSKEVVFRMIEESANVLKESGKFYLAGAKRKGVRACIEKMHGVFGNTETLIYRKGYRVGVSIKSGEAILIQDKDIDQIKDIEIRGQKLRVILNPGVFAKGDLDEGTKMLIETMQIDKGDTVLDLGCGSGIIGMVAARLADEGKVYLVDSNLLAVNLAKKNLDLNGIGNAKVISSDGLKAVEDIRFDVVAMNPPFHLGREKTLDIANKLIEEAYFGLRKGGRFYLVSNRFLPYEKTMEMNFGHTKTLHETGRYKVLMAKRS